MSRKEKWEKIKEKVKKRLTKRRIAFLIVLLFMVYIAAMFLTPRMDREMRENVSYVRYTQFQELLETGEIRFEFLNNGSNMQFLPSISYLEEIGLEVTDDYEELLQKLEEKKETSVDSKIVPSKGPYKFITENPA